MDAKQFGAFVAQTRRQRGMTQADLAERLYVTDKAVSRWERGKGFPDINSLESLASALGISVLELMKNQIGVESGQNDRELAELLRSATELRRDNRRQEQTASSLAGYMTVVVGLLAWIMGVGNVGSSLFFGALTAVPLVCLFFFAENREDRAGRRVYACIGLAAAVILAALLLRIWTRQ